MLVVGAALGVGGCTAGGDADPEEPVDETTTITASPATSGASPVVFAFVCREEGSGRTSTFTTYAAAWQDEQTECEADRITGTEASSQQRAAVADADGDASLEELAAVCAERGVGPWGGRVGSEHDAHVAAGLLRYCPGHPETDHLREALAAWRG